MRKDKKNKAEPFLFKRRRKLLGTSKDEFHSNYKRRGAPCKRGTFLSNGIETSSGQLLSSLQLNPSNTPGTH